MCHQSNQPAGQPTNQLESNRIGFLTPTPFNLGCLPPKSDKMWPQTSDNNKYNYIIETQSDVLLPELDARPARARTRTSANKTKDRHKINTIQYQQAHSTRTQIKSLCFDNHSNSSCWSKLIIPSNSLNKFSSTLSLDYDEYKSSPTTRSLFVCTPSNGDACLDPHRRRQITSKTKNSKSSPTNINSPSKASPPYLVAMSLLFFILLTNLTPNYHHYNQCSCLLVSVTNNNGQQTHSNQNQDQQQSAPNLSIPSTSSVPSNNNNHHNDLSHNPQQQRENDDRMMILATNQQQQNYTASTIKQIPSQQQQLESLPAAMGATGSAPPQPQFSSLVAGPASSLTLASSSSATTNNSNKQVTLLRPPPQSTSHQVASSTQAAVSTSTSDFLLNLVKTNFNNNNNNNNKQVQQQSNKNNNNNNSNTFNASRLPPQFNKLRPGKIFSSQSVK